MLIASRFQKRWQEACGTKEGAKKVGNTVTGTTYKATCNDGTSYSGKTKDGACKDHGGVKSWGK